MSDGMPYADIVILALVAVFVLLRLRSVLGQKNEGDETMFKIREMLKSVETEQPIVQVKEASLKPKPMEEQDVATSSITDVLMLNTINNIKAKDPQFSLSYFMQGAKMAFEMVFDAFAKGDTVTLKMLMSESVYSHFEAEINRRKTLDVKPETTLVSVQAKGLSEASLVGNIIKLSVDFTSEQVTVQRDASGTVLDGHTSPVQDVVDNWTFERDVTSKNPNWKIIDT